MAERKLKYRQIVAFNSLDKRALRYHERGSETVTLWGEHISELLGAYKEHINAPIPLKDLKIFFGTHVSINTADILNMRNPRDLAANINRLATVAAYATSGTIKIEIPPNDHPTSAIAIWRR